MGTHESHSETGEGEPEITWHHLKGMRGNQPGDWRRTAAQVLRDYDLMASEEAQAGRVPLGEPWTSWRPVTTMFSPRLSYVPAAGYPEYPVTDYDIGFVPGPTASVEPAN